MTPKFWLRTFRNLLIRKRPYFAHLALTHRCNLACRFCTIPQEHIEELNTEGMKRVIDRLDRMGVAILAFSAGGEPLLRPDFADIVNYGANKGLYCRLISNGTVSQEKYDELLATRLSEIAISLDGVRGDDLPYSHVGPKLLATLRHLNDHMPKEKFFSINITVWSGNYHQVEDIVDYCTREFPRARLWLNPVVVGQGRSRSLTQLKMSPDYLHRIKSPTLLSHSAYRKDAEEYFRNEHFDWGCLAGELFFDIKPNGDFWICQDHPARPPLNILDPDFERKYREADFSFRRECSGCIYPCYWASQKFFEPRNWPDMAAIWWNRSTRPDEPCRRTVAKYGRMAGFLHFCALRLAHTTRSATARHSRNQI
jgi:MoaA/NifB/PqqE/SkfB family radical SAM enzyme